MKIALRSLNFKAIIKNNMYPIIVFVVTRLLIVGIGVLAEVSIPSQTDVYRQGLVEKPPVYIYQKNIVLDILTRWDGSSYLGIVFDGYHYATRGLSTVAFFPFYPLLITIVSMVTSDAVIAGVLISNVAFLLALVIYYIFTKEKNGEDVARRAVLYLAIFPTTIYYSAVYAESLFLLFSLCVFFFIERKKWFFVGLFGAAASGTRFIGITLWPLALLCFMAPYRNLPKATRDLANYVKKGCRDLLSLLLMPLGLGVYMVYLQVRFSNAFAFISAQRDWGWYSFSPIAVVGELARNAFGSLFHVRSVNYVDVLNFIPLVLLVVTGSTIKRRMGWVYLLYVTLSLLVPLSLNSASLVRYCMVLFPIFTALAYLGKNTTVNNVILITFSALATYVAVLFVNFFWIA